MNATEKERWERIKKLYKDTEKTGEQLIGTRILTNQDVQFLIKRVEQSEKELDKV